jgi:hypothetical protein
MELNEKTTQVECGVWPNEALGGFLIAKTHFACEVATLPLSRHSN